MTTNQTTEQVVRYFGFDEDPRRNRRAIYLTPKDGTPNGHIFYVKADGMVDGRYEVPEGEEPEADSVRLTIYGSDDESSVEVTAALTPDEALSLARDLIQTAQNLLR